MSLDSLEVGLEGDHHTFTNFSGAHHKHGSFRRNLDHLGHFTPFLGSHHKRKLLGNLDHLGLFTNFSIDHQINTTKPSRRRWPPRVINSRTLTQKNRCRELKPMKQMQFKVKQRMLNSLSQSHKVQLKKVRD